MKKLFRKAVSVLGSVAMIGATISGAAAATYPAPFDSGNYAVVYGSTNDLAAANTIAAGLPALGGETTTVGNFSFTDSITDNEVELRTSITAGASADIDATILDNKLDVLRDEKLAWDDGGASGSDDYDFHEALIIGTMKPITTMDDEKLDGVALTNELALKYELIFEDALNVSGVGDTDADTLYLEIMGQEYEITDATATSITVVTSEEMSLSIGSTYTTPEGKVVTLVDVFSGSVEVSVDGENEVISTGDTEKVNGIRINVDSVGYHENSPETSKAILKIGTDIEKTYTSGDEYIGEDEDDPLWVWEISNLDSASGYIGVAYNADIDSSNDEVAGDTIKYVGSGYVMPHNFAAVSLDGLTDVDYQDLKIYFEDSADLFPDSDTSTAMVENADVIVIEGDNTDTLTVNGNETDKMYIYWNHTANVTQTFYRDVDGDYTPTNKMRLADNSVTTYADGTTEHATVEIGETNLDIDLTIDMTLGTGVVTPWLMITNDQAGNAAVLNLSIGGSINANTSTGGLAQLGATEEDADALDIVFNGTDKSTNDYSYMDMYGVIVSDGTTVESEADNDEVTLSIPEDQVYAIVTVGTGAVVSNAPSTSGQKTFMDTETSSYSTKNIVVVGGSCVNDVAATLLGGAHCGDAFTGATGIGPGGFLIETFSYGTDKVATVVAGYEKDDTAKAATYIANTANVVTTNVGDKYQGETATENAVLVS